MTKEEKNEMCKNCRERKIDARIYGIHYYWENCPFACDANEEMTEIIKKKMGDRQNENRI